jgi:very-short-patch-repair endonuclease
MKFLSKIDLARILRKNPTPAERYFWSKVRRKQILGLRIQRQYVISHSNIIGKESFFIVDFYCHAKKLIIELDGGVHQHQVEYDEARTKILESLGLRVIRFTNNDVLNKWLDVESVLKKELGPSPDNLN